MVDPLNITNYNLTDEQLEEHLLFWVCAAGKNAKIAARGLDFLLTDLERWYSSKFSPFRLIKLAGEFLDLPGWLKGSGIGCFNQKARTFYELATSGLNLRTCTVNSLEGIYGIGPKTSRCFILHSRKGARVAGLDTHVLKYLRDQGHEVPKSTPSSKKMYRELEQLFLGYADQSGMNPADFDLEIWKFYAGKG